MIPLVACICERSAWSPRRAGPCRPTHDAPRESSPPAPTPPPKPALCVGGLPCIRGSRKGTSPLPRGLAPRAPSRGVPLQVWVPRVPPSASLTRPAPASRIRCASSPPRKCTLFVLAGTTSTCTRPRTPTVRVLSWVVPSSRTGACSLRHAPGVLVSLVFALTFRGGHAPSRDRLVAKLHGIDVQSLLVVDGSCRVPTVPALSAGEIRGQVVFGNAFATTQIGYAFLSGGGADPTSSSTGSGSVFVVPSSDGSFSLAFGGFVGTHWTPLLPRSTRPSLIASAWSCGGVVAGVGDGPAPPSHHQPACLCAEAAHRPFDPFPAQPSSVSPIQHLGACLAVRT